MYNIGDTVVHPLHGAGVIDDIEERRVGGVTASYYVFLIPLNGMRLLIPADGCAAIGVRPLISEADAVRVLDALDSVEADVNANWNRRYRENIERIKSGDHLAVASVVKALLMRDNGKGLSSGERDMLRLAKQILVSELALATGIAFNDIDVRISETLCPS
jgi:CarD family transcriptional regulator